jgi:hypothetical protein
MSRDSMSRKIKIGTAAVRKIEKVEGQKLIAHALKCGFLAKSAAG